MKESRKTFTIEFTIAIISLVLAIVIYTQYRAYQQEKLNSAIEVVE